MLHHAHRSPPVDPQNSASTVETDQPEDPAVGTKRAGMMAGSKIVLPSCDVYEYTGNTLRSTISRIADYKSMILFSYRPKSFDFLVDWRGRNFYTSANRPSWWPKDVAFYPLLGMCSQKFTA